MKTMQRLIPMSRLRFLLLPAVFSLALCSTASSQDDPSQRLLPLPQSDGLNMAQHMELLKRLRSLMESQQSQKPKPSSESDDQATPPASPAKPGSTQPPATPSPDAPLPPEQVQRLQDALKKLADKLPPGFVPPNLGDVPPEQLKKTMENPAVQQQMRDMLQQFSQDGVIPPPQSNGRSPLPLPPQNDPPDELSKETSNNAESDRRPPTSQKQNSDESPQQEPPLESLNKLKDFLNRLADESKTSPESSTSPGIQQSPGMIPQNEQPADNPSVSPNGTLNDPSGSPPKSRPPLRRRDRNRKRSPETSPENTDPNGQTDPKSPENSAGPTPSDGPSAGTTPVNPTPNLQPDSPEMQTPDSGSDATDRQPTGESSRRAPSVPNQPPLNSEGNNSSPRDEGKSPTSPATDPSEQLRQLQELQKALEQLRDSADSAPAEKTDGSGSGTTSPPMRFPPSIEDQNSRNRSEVERGTKESTSDVLKDSRSPGNSSNSPPEIPEFLKQQLKNLDFPPTPAEPASPTSPSDAAAKRPQQNSSSSPPEREPAIEPRAITPPPAIKPREDVKNNVKQELNRKGFGETLKGIVERATKESRQPPKNPQSNETADPNAAAETESQSVAISDSMLRTLDGLKDDLAEIAKDARFNPPAPEQNQRQPSRTSPAENSAIDQLRKAASEFLAAPADTTPRNSPVSPVSSASPAGFDAQFDLTPVLVLTGVLAAAALGFFGLRHWKTQASLYPGQLVPAGVPLPSEIRSRDDLVRAFHAFSLRSAHRVQTWWTHRDVQRLIAESAPEKKAAVEILANAYEQARYLPDDRELSSEEILSARDALQQCATGQRSV